MPHIFQNECTTATARLLFCLLIWLCSNLLLLFYLLFNQTASTDFNTVLLSRWILYRPSRVSKVGFRTATDFCHADSIDHCAALLRTVANERISTLLLRGLHLINHLINLIFVSCGAHNRGRSTAGDYRLRAPKRSANGRSHNGSRPVLFKLLVLHWDCRRIIAFIKSTNVAKLTCPIDFGFREDKRQLLRLLVWGPLLAFDDKVLLLWCHLRCIVWRSLCLLLLQLRLVFSIIIGLFDHYHVVWGICEASGRLWWKRISLGHYPVVITGKMH